VVEMTKEEKNFGNDKHSYFALPTLAKKKVSCIGTTKVRQI
jgi:hypothetical protein